MAAKEKTEAIFSLAALSSLPETRIRASGTENRSGIGAVSWLSSTLPWGCRCRYGTTASDPLVREKFGTYTRDGYTGLDYADQRYYAATYGRFDTPDPSYKSARLSDPGSFNRYSYSSLDPVNRNDPNGLCDVVLAGIAMASPNSGDLLDYGSDKITVFPYSAFANTTDLAGAFGSRLMGVLEVAAQRLGPTSSSYAAVVGLIMASQDGKPINVTAFSGGAGAFTSAVNFLNANGGSSVTSLINNITYVEPGAAGAVYQNGQTMTITAAGLQNELAGLGIDKNGALIDPLCAGKHDFGCIYSTEFDVLNKRSGASCSTPTVVNQENGINFYQRFYHLDLFYYYGYAGTPAPSREDSN